jgi:signal peptidase I
MRALGRWLLWSLIALGVLVGVLRATAIRWWRVPSGDPYLDASVAPSLRGGDLVLLWRLTPPAIGSLALCPEPQHPERVVIGRMVGEDRGTVRIEGTRVFVNDKELTNEGSCTDDHFQVTPPQGGADVEQRCSLEVAGGVAHPRGEAEATAEVATFEVSLKSGEVALVSDNRRYPYDSRDYGPVEQATCTETVFFRLLGGGGFFDTSRRFQYVR